MGKFKNQQDLRFVATHLEEISKARSGRGIYFCFDTKNNGALAYDMIANIYPSNDMGYGIDKRDFVLLFGGRDKRDPEYDALSEEISNYRVNHPNEVSQAFGQDDDPDADPASVNTTRDWTTYIIVGAAAVILLLLLWDRK